MGHTVIGVFRHSGDAEMAASHLREEYVLEADELDLIGPAEWDNLARPAADEASDRTWWQDQSIAVAALGNAFGGDEEPIGKRWGDKVWGGEILVVARTGDPEEAESIARDLRESGAERVDLLPH